MSGSSSIVVDSEIAVTNAELGNKEAPASSFTGEIGATEAEVGNKEAAGKGVITEAAWIESVFLTKPPAGTILERKAESPTVDTMITKERVPDSFIDILKKRHVFKKVPPFTYSEFNNVHSKYPKLRDLYILEATRRNYCVDLHEDVLRQHAEKGFAEVGVDFTDGVKKIFILSRPQEPKEEDKLADEPTTVAMITKEMVPQSFIDRIKTHPSRKLPPLSQEVTELYNEFFPNEPEAIASELENITCCNYFVDLEQDCLRQHAEKGYAEVGVIFTNGIKQLFILPQGHDDDSAGSSLGNGSGGRSKTKLVFSGVAMIVFALVVLLLSCLLSRVMSVQV